jgi:glycogen(starch) synthase
VKILHVLETSVPDLVGYTIRAKYIVENQKKYGMEPVVVTSPFFKGNHTVMDFDDINGIKYYRTNFIKIPLPSEFKLLSYWTRYKMIQQYKEMVLGVVEKEKPDVIHAHSSYTNGVAANYASGKTGIPSLYELRTLWGEAAVVENGLMPNSLKHRAVWRLELNTMRRAKGIIAISEGIKEAIVDRGIDSDKIEIVPNGVDTAIFYPTAKDEYLVRKYKLSGSFVIGFIGSLRKLEGLSCLLEAFKEVKTRVPGAKVLIVGGGPEKEKLELLAHTLDLTDNVICTGSVPHDEILNYYSIIDLFIYPRIDATINQKVTPLKPLEAMATGKVCICSNVRGLTELIKDDYNGLSFRSEDVSDLAKKIIILCDDKEKYERLRSNGLSWVKKEREWSVLIPKYGEIYNKLLRLGGVQ